ncbi:MAG: ATP-binding protein [Dysgonamonadaceae bacterium]|jgi:hypothetical protein|nr:ATP-binding protein [Dysgonamonadaceae bacterium]
MLDTQNITRDMLMTKKQLLEHLQDIEWDNFEVKAARTDIPKDVWETVSAFSNTSGGSLNKASYRRFREYLKGFNPNVHYNSMDDEFNQCLKIVSDGKLTYGGLFSGLFYIAKYIK